MELEYRKRKRVKIPKDSFGNYYDFIVWYGLCETIHMIHPNEKDVKCTVLYKIKELKSRKRFIIYTDNKITSADELHVFSGYYHPFALFNRICPIEVDEDWRVVEVF